MSVYTISISATSNYYLRDSFILDSNTNIHVYNNRTRFQSFKFISDDEFLYAGNITVSIKDFGSVTITIQAPEESRQIIFTKIIFISSFHTNVASLDYFITKDIHWDTKQNKLTYEDRTFCAVQRQNNQWVLKYNELKNIIFLTRSA